MRILLFNPETEYALATGASFYTPPAVVDAMRRERQLLPAEYAEEGDLILIDSLSEINERIGSNGRTGSADNIQLIDWADLAEFCHQHPEAVIEPWGWNHALHRRLLDAGVPEEMLPSLESINRIRELAHRRTTILLNEEWNRLMPSHAVDVPVELHSEEDCIAYWKEHPGCWMKAPWSSSGRGVINTAADMEERHIRPWCRGIIRRQGSVMVETAAENAGDFATEWVMRDGRAFYLGLSAFSTSNRGKYLSNMIKNQSELEAQFKEKSTLTLDGVVEVQKKILEKVMVGYEGPLGVDMIVEKTGSIRPFVEVNLRRTMGMLNIRCENTQSGSPLVG